MTIHASPPRPESGPSTLAMRQAAQQARDRAELANVKRLLQANLDMLVDLIATIDEPGHFDDGDDERDSDAGEEPEGENEHGETDRGYGTVDDEPCLGSLDGAVDQTTWAAGNRSDLEEENEHGESGFGPAGGSVDFEPSLGATEAVNHDAATWDEPTARFAPDAEHDDVDDEDGGDAEAYSDDDKCVTDDPHDPDDRLGPNDRSVAVGYNKPLLRSTDAMVAELDRRLWDRRQRRLIAPADLAMGNQVRTAFASFGAVDHG